MKIFGLDILRAGVRNIPDAEPAPVVEPEARDSSTFSNPAAWVEVALNNLNGMVPDLVGSATNAGVTVTPDLALKLTTVFVCVDLVARTGASLPLAMLERIPFGWRTARRHATEQNLYTLLHDSPNEEMTSFTWRYQQFIDLLLRGNCLSKIERNRAGEVVGLWPKPWRYVTVSRSKSGGIIYELKIPGAGEETYRADEVLHVMGFTLDGLVGLSPISMARNGVGLAMSVEDYNAYFFKNGGLVKDTLNHPAKLSKEAAEKLRESWTSRHGVNEVARGTAILEEGMEYKVTTIPAEDVLFLDSRRFTREDLAALFHVPPQFANEFGRATWGNAGIMDVAFNKHACRPLYVNFEQTMALKLLSLEQRKKFYFLFNADAILRGDNKSQMDSYDTGLKNGSYAINDVLELMDRNPIAGGDVHLVQVNQIPVEQIGKVQEPASTEGARQLDITPLLRDAAARIVRRAAADLARQASKQQMRDNPPALEAWEREYFAVELREYAAEVLAPICTACGLELPAAALTREQTEEIEPLCAYLSSLLEVPHEP